MSSSPYVPSELLPDVVVLRTHAESSLSVLTFPPCVSPGLGARCDLSLCPSARLWGQTPGLDSLEHLTVIHAMGLNKDLLIHWIFEAKGVGALV